ncbi:MAG: bifunctional oligoribonuclease/PAP phosphatase NrnA [Planctomycetota bacterium]|nr:MAG: bifunctional oligoribonuclease/PAP phosphatase NrnA [Planctomycetota bacterium]
MDRDLLQEAGRRLSGWERTMILTHVRPDGDGLGAMAALKRVIESAGRQATAYVYAEIPDRYKFLGESGGFIFWQDDDPQKIDAQFDGILIFDTCSWSQLEPVADYLRKSSLPKIVVDHHDTNDDLATMNSNALYIIDSTAASTSEIAYAWLRAMNSPIDSLTAEALFTGIATDTGWFRFSNTNSRTFLWAADLLESGIRPDKLYATIYSSYSLERLRLMGHMLSTLELHADGALAIMSITREMFDKTGAKATDTEELVNEPLDTGPVAVSVLLSEMRDGRIRVNFRSKAPEVAGVDVDVSQVAKQFGGGGHQRASATRVEGKLDEVRKRVTAAILSILNAQPAQ